MKIVHQTLFKIFFLVIVFTVQGQAAYAQSEDVEPTSQNNGAARGESAAPVLISTAVLSGEAVFEYNRYVLSAESIEVLNKLIRDLNDFALVESVKVIGHTDDRGSEKYNQQLSEKRARYIAQFFARKFPAIAVSAHGLGEMSPIASNATPEGRERNRRVEIQVVAKGQPETL